MLLFIAVFARSESVSIPCASLAALVFSASRAIGESTVVGYIKAIPQELVCIFGTGTGLGDSFQTLATLFMVHYGTKYMQYTVFFAFSLIPYFMFFTYFEEQRLSHKQHKNIFKIEVKTVEEFGRPQVEQLNDSIVEDNVSVPSRSSKVFGKSKTVKDQKKMRASFNSSDLEAY